MAGNHVIGATLTLKDNMSATLQGVRREQAAFRQDVQTTQRTLRQQMEVRVNATAATRAIASVRTAIAPLRNRIVTAVAIRDNATRETRRIRNELNALGRRAVAPIIRARDATSKVINSIKSKLEGLKNLAKGLLIGGTVVGAAVGAGALGALKSGAMLEQQQISMKHFIGVNNKDKSDADITNISSNYVKDLRDNANMTPFVTADVISAGSKAVTMSGGDTKKAMDLVKISEDMASLNPGKSLDDAVEALAMLKMGQTKRMQEFGFHISKEDVKNNKGDITNLKNANGISIAQMFHGGASEEANTGTGLVSTIKGKLGSKLQDTGIKMLEKLKPALSTVIESIDKYSPQMEAFGLKIADGLGFAISKLPTLKQYLKEAFESAKPTIAWMTDVGFPKISELAVKVGTGLKNTFEFAKPGLVWMGTVGFPAIVDTLGWVMDKASSVYNFFKTNWGTLGPFIEGIAIAFGIYKTVMGAIELVTIAVTAAQLALNLAMNLNPVGLIILGIGLLIGLGILLYQNWDTLKEKASDVWVTIENAFKTGVNGAIGLINDLIGMINKIPGVHVPIIAKVEMSKTTSEKLDSKWSATNDAYAKAYGYGKGNDERVNGSHANGLNYVPFDGYIAELHKGERVQRASENPYNGSSGSSASSKAGTVSIGSLVNTLVVREEADIHKIAVDLAYELKNVSFNMV